MRLAIREAFLRKSNEVDWLWPKENTAIATLAHRCVAREDARGFAQKLLETYWRLIHSQDKFWTGQPWMPSALAASGLYPRVLKALEDAPTADIGFWKGLWE